MDPLVASWKKETLKKLLIFLIPCYTKGSGGQKYKDIEIKKKKYKRLVLQALLPEVQAGNRRR